MAIKLEDKQNVLAPNGTYPYGDILDNPGDNTGTPVNRAVYADFHQFFAFLAGYGFEALNGLPDNATNTFQYFESLIDAINKSACTHIIRALIGGYTTNDVVKLWGCTVTANIPGTSTITAGAIFYNDKIYAVGAASIPSAAPTLVFKINTLVNPNTIYLQNADSNSGIADYDGANVKSYDTGWIAISAYSTYVTGNAYYRKIGQQVLLRGFVIIDPLNSWSFGAGYFSLPIGFRPTAGATLQFPNFQQNNSTGPLLSIYTQAIFSGVITGADTSTAPTASAQIFLDSISYIVA